jgi:hypothetical protein
MLNLEVDG